MYKVMSVNLGGTSTKLSIFHDETLFREGTFRHTDEELAACKDNAEQIAFRKSVADRWIAENSLSLDDLDAVVVRVSSTGGMAKKSGAYLISGKLQAFVMDMYEKSFPKAMHPSFITYPLVKSLLGDKDIPIYVVDPEDLDEFDDVARVTGHPDFPRYSGCHMLNQKAVARKVAKDLGKPYNELNLVVAHLGGGVSIASHCHGRVIDGTSGGPAGEGPFATNRTGPLPLDKVVEACFSGKYQKRDMIALLMARGGFVAHTGLTDLRLIEEKAANGDANCDLVIRAFIYQVNRYIGAQYTVLDCDCDAIVLTGGIAYSERVVQGVRARVGKLAPVLVYPGEEETESMVAGALRVLRGEESAIEV